MTIDPRLDTENNRESHPKLFMPGGIVDAFTHVSTTHIAKQYLKWYRASVELT